MSGLSKSKYTTFCQCQKALWLKTYKSEVEVIDKNRQAILERGNKVGDLAMGLFGNYVEVTTLLPDGNLDLTTMINKTQQEMAKGTDVICEASFSYQNNYCAVDLLRKTDRGWSIYEVKSISSNKPNKLEDYFPDIAYQKWVLTQCGVNVIGTYLVCLNSNYVRDESLDLSMLFSIIDVSELIKNEYELVPERVEKAKTVLDSKIEPDIDLSENCKKPHDCSFWNYCTRNLPKPNVFDLYGTGFSFGKKLDCYRNGNISFDSLQEMSFDGIRGMQIEAALTGRAFINREGIQQFLNTLSYPLYFLDFETMELVVPEFKGTKPFQQIPFQYSLHIKESETASCQHKEFLAASDGSDPRRSLAEQLCKDFPKDVCTLAYHKSTEYNIINKLAEDFPDLAGHLMNICKNIKDLRDPFKDGHYYVSAMGKSFSIKSVLPALFPNDPSLNYYNLDDRVQNGTEAMDIFPKIKDMQPNEATTAREALLSYCELDTWAMVKVLERLEEAAK
ncbi:MAG: DUF2779 domain-containing protein [Bacteroidales bacterium]|nr:DUF2779 domain-containing protein [Bacteroidales bacterium]